MVRDYWIQRYEKEGKDSIASGGDHQALVQIAGENIDFLFSHYTPKCSIGLDFGCGYGRLTPMLLKHTKKIILYDFNPVALKDAVKNLSEYPQVTFITERKLHSTKSLCLDFVFTYTVTQHIKGMEFFKTVQMFKRHLKKGGIWLGLEYTETIKELKYMNRYNLTDYTEGFGGTMLFAGPKKVAPRHPPHTAFVFQKT